MSASVRFEIIDDYVINLANSRRLTWYGVVKTLDHCVEDDALRDTEFIFEFPYPDSDNNEDILTLLLEFTLFLCQVWLKDPYKVSVGKVTLQIKSDTVLLDSSVSIALKSILINYFKFMNMALWDRLTIQVNNERLNITSGKVFSQITHSYIPAFPYDIRLHSELFGTTIATLLERYGLKLEDCSFTFDKENAPVEYAKFLINFIRDNISGGLELSSPLRIAIDEWIIDSTNQLSLFEALIHSLYYQSFRTTGRRSPNSIKEELEGYVTQAKSISVGIREICDNIIKHTDNQLGLLYLRIQNERDANTLKLPSDYSVHKLHWFELSVVDFNEKGILDTYYQEEDSTWVVSDLAAMYSFATDISQVFKQATIIGKELSAVSVSSIDIAEDIHSLLFHHGLKIFSNLVASNNGFFSVATTNHQNGSLAFMSYDDNLVSFEKAQHRIGTKYRVVIPVLKVEQENTSKITPRFGTQSFNYYQELPKYLDSSPIYTLTWEYEDIARINTSDATSQVETLEELFRMHSDFFDAIRNEAFETIIVDFHCFRSLDNTLFDMNKLLYFMLLLILSDALNLKTPSRTKRYVLFTGLTRDVISRLRNSYLSLLEKYTKLPTISDNLCPWVYLFDDIGEPYILNGFNRDENDSINSYYRDFRMMEPVNTGGSSLSGEDKTALLFPVEVLEGKGLSSPVYYSHVKNLLSHDLKKDSFGLRHKKHVKLGSKIHTDTFFQAELLFENSYYTDCFAYILAREIYQQGEEEIILVGYKEYSKMLIEKIRRLLENVGIVVETITYYEDDEIERLKEEFTTIQNTVISKKSFATARFCFIVPVSSSLKTFNKIYAALIRAMQEISNNSGKFAFVKPPMNYSIIELRDSLNTKGEGQCTSLEKGFGWLKHDDNVIEIEYDFPFNQTETHQIVHYCLEETAIWHDATDCPVCNESKQPLLEAHNASLILMDNLGLPYVLPRNSFLSQDAYLGDYQKATSLLVNDMYYGHIQRGQNEYLYYFDTDGYFHHLLESGLKSDLEIWAASLYNLFSSVQQDTVNQVNILLVPDHYSNNAFVEWILENVFNRTGLVIREDFTKEFYSNFMHKYSYLKQQSNRLRFFFVDDFLSSGRTFFRCRSFAAELVPDNEKVEISIVSLLNRLDHQNFGLISTVAEQCVSFMEIYIPVIKEQTGECWLCTEYEYLRSKDSSLMDESLRSFNKKLYMNYLNPVDVTNGHQNKLKPYRDRAGKQYMKERFLLENLIYTRLMSVIDDGNDLLGIYETLGLDSTGQKIAVNLLKPNDQTAVDVSYKMNLTRILCMPFLNRFILVREVACLLLTAELKAILGDFRKTELDDITEQYLCMTITHLAMLHSPVIIEQANIQLIHAKLSKEGSFLTVRSAYQRLASFDQSFEYILLHRAVDLYNFEQDKHSEFARYLERIILENNTIISNAVTYYKRDSSILIGNSNASKVLGNYYYEAFRKVWQLFTGEWNQDEAYSWFVSSLTYNQLHFGVLRSADDANQTQNAESNWYFCSRDDSTKSFVQISPPVSSNNSLPPIGDTDNPAFWFSITDQAYYASYCVDDENYAKYRCVIRLTDSALHSMLLYKLMIIADTDAMKKSLHKHLGEHEVVVRKDDEYRSGF